MAAITVDVPPFLLDADAGDCGIHAVRSVLAALGRDVDYDTLKAVSGDGFKFVYDPGAVFEPMRELAPSDFVRDALACFGIIGAWQTGLTLEDLDRALPDALGQKLPVLTSNLLDTSSGYQVIVGYEPGDVPRAAVRGGLLAADLEADAAPTRPARWIELDADWNGPVSGRARWDLNPVFLIESVTPPTDEAANPDATTLLRRAASAGMRVGEVFEIAYGTSGLEQDHAEEPLAGRSAAHGAEAWAMFIEEIRSRPPLTSSAFIWKADTVARRLAHDREALARFFEAAARSNKEERANLEALVATLRETARGARELRNLVWFEDASRAASADDVQRLLTSSRALAYPLPEDDAIIDALRAAGYDDRIETLDNRGTAVLMQDDVRWRELLGVVRRLADLEADLEAALPRLAS